NRSIETLAQRPPIIPSARTASRALSIRLLLRWAGPLRPDFAGSEAAICAGVVSTGELNANRQLRAAAELGRWPHLRHLDVRSLARAWLGHNPRPRPPLQRVAKMIDIGDDYLAAAAAYELHRGFNFWSHRT